VRGKRLQKKINGHIEKKKGWQRRVGRRIVAEKGGQGVVVGCGEGRVYGVGGGGKECGHGRGGSGGGRKI